MVTTLLIVLLDVTLLWQLKDFHGGYLFIPALGVANKDSSRSEYSSIAELAWWSDGNRKNINHEGCNDVVYCFSRNAWVTNCRWFLSSICRAFIYGTKCYDPLPVSRQLLSYYSASPQAHAEPAISLRPCHHQLSSPAEPRFFLHSPEYPRCGLGSNHAFLCSNNKVSDINSQVSNITRPVIGLDKWLYLIT